MIRPASNQFIAMACINKSSRNVNYQAVVQGTRQLSASAVPCIMRSGICKLVKLGVRMEISTQMIINPLCLVLSEVETVLAPDLLVVEWSTTGPRIINLNDRKGAPTVSLNS